MQSANTTSGPNSGAKTVSVKSSGTNSAVRHIRKEGRRGEVETQNREDGACTRLNESNFSKEVKLLLLQCVRQHDAFRAIY